MIGQDHPTHASGEHRFAPRRRRGLHPRNVWTPITFKIEGFFRLSGESERYRRRPSQRRALCRPRSAIDEDDRPTTVLVAEDELLIAMHLEHRLARHGYLVPPAVASVADGLAFLRAARPDLAML